MDAFRWAFIGAGTLAKQVARDITASRRHRIVSVYTRRPEKCRAFGELYGAVPAPTAREAICQSGVDGVYVVTPHSSHYEYARLALTLGKPVLCEKPITTDAAHARELAGLSRERGVYLAEGMWTWFSPVAHRVKQWLDDGRYGDISSVTATYHLLSALYAPRVTDPAVGGGALLDVGVYPIAYLCRLFGTPTSVRCTGRLKKGIDLGEEVELSFQNGKTFTASVSITDPWGLERLRIRGSRGETVLPFYHSASKVRLRRCDGGSESFTGDGSILHEFDTVAGEIRRGLTESPLVPHRATLEVMEVLDECRRQMGLVYPFERG